MAAGKVPWLSEETIVKYQRITQFTIGPNSIHVQVLHDLNRKWFPVLYKLSNADLETMVNDWPAKWRELVILEEVSKVPLADAPVDSVHKDD